MPVVSDRHHIGTFYDNNIIIIIIFDRVYKLVRGDGFFFSLRVSTCFIILLSAITIDSFGGGCCWLTGGGYNVWAGMRPHEHSGGKRNGLHSIHYNVVAITRSSCHVVRMVHSIPTSIIYMYIYVYIIL